MSELQKILEDQGDTRPLIEQAIDLLSDDDAEAITEALRSSLYASTTIRVALATDAAVRDADKVPSADSIYAYRRRKGWL